MPCGVFDLSLRTTQIDNAANTYTIVTDCLGDDPVHMLYVPKKPPPQVRWWIWVGSSHAGHIVPRYGDCVEA